MQWELFISDNMDVGIGLTLLAPNPVVGIANRYRTAAKVVSLVQPRMIPIDSFCILSSLSVCVLLGR